MDNFYSAKPGVQTSTKNDLVHDYLITVNPFEILTTTQVPKIDTHQGTFTVIYGIGGLLIILIIFAYCYRICMPLVEKARIRRTIKRRREELRERLRLTGRLSDEDLPAVSGTSTTQMQTEISPSIVQNTVNRDESDDESQGATRDMHVSSPNPPDNEEINFSRIFKSLLTYPDTEVKQNWENGHFAHRSSDTSESKKLQEQMELPHIARPGKEKEVNELSPENLTNKSCSVTVQKYLNQSDSNQNPNEKETDVALSADSSRVSTELLAEGRSQSFPTSPEVRRRFPSLENTLRRWSSSR